MWNEEEAKVSAIYFLLFHLFSLLFLQGKWLYEVTLQTHKFKYWKAKSSQIIVRQLLIKVDQCWILIYWKRLLELNTYKKWVQNKTHTLLVGEHNW